MKKLINVGVVGCGYWGPNLVRNFRLIPECRLKAMCDLSQDRLRHLHSLYPEVEGITDFQQLLSRDDIDAVCVATSARLHFRMAKAVLTAGKHVLIEKPMACSTAECLELIELARKQGLVLMVGHTFLYSSVVRKICEIVNNRDIGEMRYISSRRLNLGLFQTDINVAWDLAPHDLSIILHIMRELPLSVSCRGAAHITNGIEDVTSMSLNFAQQKSAIIHSSWHDPRKVREMTIVGSKRMIVYDDIATQEKIKIYDVRVERPPHYDTFAEFHYAYHYGDTYCPHIKQDEPLRTECQHFIDCIQQGLVPISNGDNGMDVVRILEAASASLKSDGAPIYLQPVSERVAGNGSSAGNPLTPQSAVADRLLNGAVSSRDAQSGRLGASGPVTSRQKQGVGRNGHSGGKNGSSRAAAVGR